VRPPGMDSLLAMALQSLVAVAGVQSVRVGSSHCIELSGPYSEGIKIQRRFLAVEDGGDGLPAGHGASEPCGRGRHAVGEAMEEDDLHTG
jgi:hypothetical protein